jgi:hypothetical protein
MGWKELQKDGWRKKNLGSMMIELGLWSELVGTENSHGFESEETRYTMYLYRYAQFTLRYRSETV